MKRILSAASVAIALGIAPMHAAPASADELIVVDVSPVATELARHLQVGQGNLPPTVNLPSKLAAVVCEVTLKQLRESGGGGTQGRCVAVSMSQGLIQAVRQAMRGG